MGRPASSDPDNLHGSKGRRNRLMDPLHSGQESPYAMGDTVSFSHADDFPQKVAFLIILLLVLTKPICVNGSDFIVVAVTEPVVGVMEGMDVNLTCLITNNQKTEARNVRAIWKKGADYPEANATTVWDKDAQKGNTTLQLKRVSQKDMERYMCIVRSRKSFDYKQITLRVVPWKLWKDAPSQESVEIDPPWAGQDMWEGLPLKMSCPFILKQGCNQTVQVKWWKENKPKSWDKIDRGISWWEKSGKGIGWLNISNPQIGLTEGKYLCLVICGIEADYGIRIVGAGQGTRPPHIVPPIGKKRREVAVHQSHERENLIIGLIRDFGMVQNVSRITACLPLPQAAGEPIPWGIIPIPLPHEIAENISTVCHIERKEREIVTVKKNVWNAALYTTEDVEVRTKQPYQEVKCENVSRQQVIWDNWKTVWGPSLLEHYSYIGAVSWCIQWTGKKNKTLLEVYKTETSTREIKEARENWNCTNVITCDTPENQINLAPLRVLLKWGCECRRFNHTILDKVNSLWSNGIRRAVSCKDTTIKSPGNLVWVMGHGQWTTHIPIDGPVTQITLGIPTLCPLWKQSRLKSNRKKREVDAFTELENEWHEPDGGVKFGWALESLFAPIATYRNREMLYKLLGQTERLAAATKKGFKDINLQLQATSRMTLQNRMALDMLLLKEHGVYQYLKTRIDHCCIHIPNMTIEVEKDISQLEIVESKTKDIEKEAQHNWIGEIFESLGLQVSGWVSSIIQYILLILILLLTVWLAYKCVLGVIEKETKHTRRVMKALTRSNEMQLSHLTPPKYEDVIGQENPAFEDSITTEN
ncbi:uncharacterized protein LOC134552841 [Prinia subflava]|uniref:uncharacterized protein LOC134552841 n=1 Tax=Prinia subflava TaxID=208062 RepID=UPI002FE0C5FD